MCDLGLVLGIASGVAQAAGAADAAGKNMDMMQQQAKLEYAKSAREQLVETDAANKEGYQAKLEQDRGVALVKAVGQGMGGSTAGAQVAEQQRQGALSIANAKDRKTAANANYIMGTKNAQITGQNDINREAISPLTALTNIATSGMQNYGAFK